VIVDGDPQSSDPQHACFPAALLESENGEVAEPLAADVRKWADGKALSKLKLASGILGVRLDELRQREQQRKRRLHALVGIGILAAAALLLFTVNSSIAEREAHMAREAQQTLAEKMLAQFLEQSERLGDVADIETRKAFSDALSSYLSDLDPANLTPESRRQFGVALANRGVILRDEGQLEQAMKVFRRAQQILQLLVEESKEDGQALFELSQVEYWIGQVHLDRGQMEEAGISFRAYADISDRLHEIQPENADWTMEAAYAQSNLGDLERRRAPSDPQRVLQYFRSALELNEEAARQDESYERELAESHAYVADAWLGVCDLQQAMDQRLKNVELAANYFELNRASNLLKQDYGHAIAGLSRVQQMSGLLDQAIESIKQSMELQAELVDEDPSNLKKRWELSVKSIFLVQLMEFSGKETESWNMSLGIEAKVKKLIDNEGVPIDNAIAYAEFLRDFAYRAYRREETPLADRMLDDSIDRLQRISDQHPDNKKVQNELTMSYFYYWDHNQGVLPDSSAHSWLASSKVTLNPVGCSALNIASRQAVMMGTPDQARIYVSQLIDRGYQDPEFKWFCSKYGLCMSQVDE
jgi:tetratricopeptide (TPR) repeat protein